MKTFAFPRFKYSQNYYPYKKQAIVYWENIIIKIGFVFLLIEIAALIEDFNHGQYTDWSVLWISKVINYTFYFFATFGRFFLLKLMKSYTCKRLFMDISEVLCLMFFIFIIIFNKDIPTGPTDPNPVWTSKGNISGYLRIVCLCFTFYNWILPGLIIAAVIAYGAYEFQKALPGYAGIYMPTYITVTLCVTIFCYYIEKSRRQNFEAQVEANMKEKVWKEILNEFPEGTLVITERKEILYVNHAFYSILNMNFERGIEELNELRTLKDISVEGFSTNTSGFGGEPQTITKFQELQDLIWSQWTSLAEHFSSPLPHEEYKIFKGQYQIDETKNKSFEIKFSIKNFGGKNVALFIFSDVSERLLVEYLKQTVEYKNRLLASVSHELRTPLNGNINFIQEAIHNPTVPENIKETRLIPAMRSAQYLLILINDILDFSQIQAQNIRLVPTVKDIVHTVKEAMQLVEIQAKKKGLELKLTPVPKDSAYEIKTDHNRVLQIIANLLSNALKFTFKGGITITLTPEENHSIRVEVEDTGIGIKQEDMSKLFKTFGKLDLGGKNYINSQGVGLGLVISNSLAKMLAPKSEGIIPSTALLDDEEGEQGIYFDSEYGKGTKFWFYVADQGEILSCSQALIPSEGGSQIHEIREFIPTESSVPLLSGRSSCSCPHFLVADDDAFNILTLETMLHGLGYTSDSAYNGQQVLDLVRNRISHPCSETCRPYRLIFLDCNMPIMDGYECITNLQQIFAQNPGEECPVIACTAATIASERDKALGSGMKDFVTKPVTKARIQELINTHCSKPPNNSNNSDSSEKKSA